MNKKGQTVALGILAAVLIFIVGSMVIDLFKDDITTARAADKLDCANAAISDGNKLMCLGIDIVVPYFFLIIISLSGGVLMVKLFK